MRAIGDKVILERLDRQEVQHGRIILPKLAVKDDYIGRVVEVGEEVTKVKAGDYVVVPVHLAIPLSLNNKDYLIVQEKNIYLILEEHEV